MIQENPADCKAPLQDRGQKAPDRPFPGPLAHSAEAGGPLLSEFPNPREKLLKIYEFILKRTIAFMGKPVILIIICDYAHRLPIFSV